MFCIKKPESGKRVFLISIIILFLSCVFLHTSCPAGTPNMYKLELNGGGSNNNYTRVIYYNPIEKAWFEDIDGRYRINSVPYLPSGQYSVTMYYNNDKISQIKGRDFYKTETISNSFQGYKIGSELCIDKDGNIKEGFKIARDVTAIAEFESSKNFYPPTIKAFNDELNSNPEIQRLQYEFIGWNPTKSWTESADNQPIKVNSDTKLYASYRANGTYSLTIDWNGATSAATEKVYYKSNQGWFKDEALTEKLNSIEIPKKEWEVKFDRVLEDGNANIESQIIKWNFENLGGTTGYVKDANGTWNDKITISSDASVKAEWSVNDKITMRGTSSQGHTFSAWILSTDSEGTKYKAGEQIDPKDVEKDVKDGVLVFKALWDDERIIHVPLISNGATNSTPSILYYFRSEKAWRTSYEGPVITSIPVPQKNWVVNFESGIKDVVNPSPLTSVWTFDGYADENGTRWIKADGNFADNMGDVTQDMTLHAQWINQTTITLPEESGTFRKDGKIFKGWMKDGSNEMRGEFRPTEEATRLIASWENMKYGIVVAADSVGTIQNPIDGVRKMLIAPQGIDVTLELSNISLPSATVAFAPEISAESVRGWFDSGLSDSGLSKDLRDSVYTISGFSDNRSRIYINIKGALDAPVSSSIDSSDIRVPSAAISNSYDTAPVTTSIYYRVSSEVKATVVGGESESGEKYYGTQENPVLGDPSKPLGNGNGVLIKIKVANASLRSNLNEQDVKKWFKNINTWFSQEILNVGIDTSSSYSEADKASYITLRLKGTPSSEMNRSFTTLVIPYSDLENGNAASGSIKAEIYYRSEKTPSIIMDPSVEFVGSSTNPFVATPDIYIGENGNGYKLRIDIGDRKFTSSDLVANENVENNRVKTWFSTSSVAGSDFASIMGSEMKYYVLGGGYNNKYIDIGIKGYTSHNPQAQTTAAISLSNNDIGILEPGAQEIGISYIITDKVQAIVDTAPPYRGGSSELNKRLRFPYHVNMGNGDGEKVKINLSNAVFTSDTAKLNVGTDISSWITTDSGMNMSNIKFVVTDGGRGTSYLIVKVQGYAVTDVLDTNALKINIPKDVIAASGESLVVPQASMYYVAGVKANATLSDNPSYYGGQGNVLKTVPYTNIGSSGEGIQIEVTLEDTNGYEFIFSDNLTNEEVTKWFTLETDSSSFTSTVGGENLTYSYVSGAGTKTVIVGIKGYITKEDLSITGEIPKIRIPSSSIKASSDNHPIITTPLYITSTSHISSRLSASPIPVEDGTTVVIEEYYAGSALRRLTGYDSMYLIQNSGEQGIPMRIELENAKWAQDLTNEDISSWFTLNDIKEVSVQKKDFGPATETSTNGKKGSSYVTILINGYFAQGASSTSQAQDVPLRDARNFFSIPSRYLQNVSENLPADNTKTVIFHNSSIISPSVEVTSPVGYVGYEANPISGAENIYLGDRAGVKVMLRLLTEADKPIRFSSNITKEQIKNWLILPDVEVIDIDYHGFASYESVTKESHKAIEFTIKGYFKTGATSDAVTRNTIRLDYSAFADSTPALQPVDVNIYTKSIGPVELSLVSDDPYKGSSLHPIEGTPYVAYGDSENGVEMRLELTNAVFSSSFTSDRLVTLFSDFTAAVNGGSSITYSVKNDTGPLKNFVVIQIKGYSRTPEIEDYFKFTLSPSDINSAAPSLSNKTVDVHYKTYKLENITVSDEEGYYGSSVRPIGMTPYVRLGENGEGIKLRIHLESNTFKTTLTEERVKQWFVDFEREVGGEGTLQYSINTTSVASGTKDLDITITGYVTKKNTSSSANIRISYSDVDGTVSDFGDKEVPIHYAITTPVAVSLVDGTDYYGTTIAPIRTVSNVVYGAGDGVKIKLALTNAKFSDEVIINPGQYTELKNWFIDGDITTREYEIIEVGQDRSTLIIQVKGYDSNEIKKQNIYNIQIPYTAIRNAESIIETISCPINYLCLGEGDAALSTGALYDGATALDPIIGRQNMLLANSSTEIPGVKIRIELTDLLFASLPEDLTGLEWFAEFKQSYGANLTFTKVAGGEGLSYIDIEVNGYPTLVENTSQNAAITIPASAIKGASASFESKIVNIYFKTLDNVTASLSTEETAFVGGSQSPLGNGLVKYIEFNNGSGVEVRLNLKNAKFKKEAVLVTQTVEGVDKVTINPDFATLLTKGLPPEFKDLSVVYTNGGDNQSFIRFILKGYIAGDFIESTGLIDIPYKYLLNGGPVNDENEKVQALWYYSPNGVSSVSALVSSTSEYYGASSKPIEGRPNVNIGSDNLGVKVRVELKNGLFDDSIAEPDEGDGESQKVKQWFTALNTIWQTSLKCTLITEPGSGIGAKYAVVNIEGVPKNSSATEIETALETSLIIPGSHIKYSHFPSDTNISTPLWYKNKEAVTVQVEASEYYVGSQAYPFKATPYITATDVNKNLMKVMVKLKDTSLSFKGTEADGSLHDNDVAAWFSGVNTALTGDSSTLKFTIERKGTNFVVVAISGYVTDIKAAAQGSVDIVVPYTNVKGASQDAGSFTVPMYYSITPKVAATVYFNNSVSTEDNPIIGYNNIYLNEKNGYIVKIVLENAKWATLDSIKIERIFTNMSTQGFRLGGGNYRRISGGENENYVEIMITGYPTYSLAGSSSGVDLSIDSQLIDSSNTGFETLTPKLFVKSSSDLLRLAEDDGQGETRYATSTAPVSGRAYLKLQNNNGGDYKIRIISEQARFRGDITSIQLSEWMKTFLDNYGKENPSSASPSSIIISLVAQDEGGRWIDIAMTGSFAQECSNYPLYIPAVAFRYLAPTITGLSITLSFNIQAKPTFTIENNTMQYARYERVEKPSSPSTLPVNKRFVVKAVNAEFDPLMFNQSTEIKPTFSTDEKTTFHIHPTDANTAYIYLSGRVDDEYRDTKAQFNIPRIVVKDAADRFNIPTESNNSALINTSAFTPYFGVNESITVSSSDIDIAIGALGSYIHTSSFSAHNSSGKHINQTINFYKVQKAVVPYMLGGNEPTSTAVIPYDYEIADVELTGGVYLTVLAWAVRNGYTFYTKANSAPQALELFGFKFTQSGTTNRGSTIDPVVGYPTFYRNAIVFCNAFTQWYNAKYGTTLEPVYRYTNGNIIKTYNFSTEIKDTAISANGGKNGFRLPSVYEWQYAAAISKDPLDATYTPYTGTAVLPSLVYAQSYLDPSGFPAKAVNVDLKNYIIYSENYGSTVAVAGVDIGSQGVGNTTSVTRKPNLLKLYDMSGNVAEWTTTSKDTTDKYVMGGHVNSSKDNVAIGSVMSVSSYEVTQMKDYPNPVGIRLVRSLR